MIMLLKLGLMLSGSQLLQAFDIKSSVETNTGNASRSWSAYAGIFTWMGMLVAKDSESSEEMLTSSVLVVLVSDGVAVGMAKQLAQRVPDLCEVIFMLTDGQTWRSDVDGITFHPEHSAKRDSLALVFLVPPAELTQRDCLGIAWPRSNLAPNPASIVGYELSGGIIRQFQKQVVLCNEDQCRNASMYFGSDFYNIYACYREYSVPLLKCKYRSGTALVYRTRSGEYSLFGIGVEGAGCCFPWVRFHPHREWVQHNFAPNVRIARAQKNSPMYDYYEDLDQEIYIKMHKGEDRTKIRWAWEGKEFVKGPCWGATGRRMYREQMHFISRRNGTFGSYSLSLYDLILTEFRCVSIWSAPSNRTKVSWLDVKTGFEQDDIDYYVKKIPISTDGKILPKIIFLLDKWRKYHDKNIKVETMEFSFIFDEDFEMEIDFWAD